MEISWIGHSSFLIKTSLGRRILMDPFSCPYIDSLNDISIITISHNHFDHNYIPKALENSIILNTLETYEDETIRIDAIKTFHDNINGHKRGDNIVFVINCDNVRIAHLGDLGHNLNTETIKSLFNIDVLCIPVGGNFTIDGKVASNLCKDISPKIIIPMHYNTVAIPSKIGGVDKFILNMGNGKKHPYESINIEEYKTSSNAVTLLSPLSLKPIDF